LYRGASTFVKTTLFTETKWVQEVAYPIFLLLAGSVPILIFVCQFLQPSFLRLCVVTAVNGIVIIVIGWFFLLNQHEREFVNSSLKGFVGRLCKFVTLRYR